MAISRDALNILKITYQKILKNITIAIPNVLSTPITTYPVFKAILCIRLKNNHFNCQVKL